MLMFDVLRNERVESHVNKKGQLVADDTKELVITVRMAYDFQMYRDAELRKKYNLNPRKLKEYQKKLENYLPVSRDLGPFLLDPLAAMEVRNTDCLESARIAAEELFIGLAVRDDVRRFYKAVRKLMAEAVEVTEHRVKKLRRKYIDLGIPESWKSAILLDDNLDLEDEDLLSEPPDVGYPDKTLPNCPDIDVSEGEGEIL